MRRRYAILLTAAAATLLVGSVGWYLFVPPAAGGTPATQPYQIEPPASDSSYRVTSNLSLECHAGADSHSVAMDQVVNVDLSADSLRSRRTVETANGTLRYAVFQNGTTAFERSPGEGSTPRYDVSERTAGVSPDLQRHLTVFPRLLRFEWEPTAPGNATTFRPREGFWVPPASLYGVRDRLYVESAQGRLVTTGEGAIVRLSLSAETVRAGNRFDRRFSPSGRCSLRLSYRYQPTREPVERPEWITIARNRTATE